MNISHLNFAQLYRLSQPETLMRVTRVYHSMLRRIWAAAEADGAVGPFRSHYAAEQTFPTEACLWQRLIAWLRGPEIRARLRSYADDICVYVTPDTWTEFRRYPVLRTDDAQDFTRALLVAKFCHSQGVPARVQETGDGTWPKTFFVFIATDKLGCATLTWKRGMDWSYLQSVCRSFGQSPRDIFWWVPAGFKGFVNPANRPVNTPDILETIDGLLTPYEKTNGN